MFVLIGLCVFIYVCVGGGGRLISPNANEKPGQIQGLDDTEYGFS